MGKAKAIGTAAESLVVAVCRRNGFPFADRLTLAGVNDKGDVRLGDGIKVVVEVKGGKQCLSLTPAKMKKWMKETEVERTNADAEIGILVTQRRGCGIVNGEKWFTHISAKDYQHLTGTVIKNELVTAELGDVLEMIKKWLSSM